MFLFLVRLTDKKSKRRSRNTTKGHEASKKTNKESKRKSRNTTKGRENSRKTNVKTKRKKRSTTKGREEDNQERKVLRDEHKAEICDQLNDPKHFMKLHEIWAQDKFPVQKKHETDDACIEKKRNPEDDFMEEDSDTDHETPPRNQLHDKHYVQAEMQRFQEDIKSWNYELKQPCRCCSRYWFHKGLTKEDKDSCQTCKEHPEYLCQECCENKMCKKCIDDPGYYCDKCAQNLKANPIDLFDLSFRLDDMEWRCNDCREHHNISHPPKLFSIFNDMQPCNYPDELKDLFEAEKMLISPGIQIMSVQYKTFHRKEYKGHVINLQQNVRLFVRTLPRRVNDLPLLFVKRNMGRDGMNKEIYATCRIRRDRVRAAINWLYNHNPTYHKYVQIDENRYKDLPVDGVPEQIRMLNIKREEKDEDFQKNQSKKRKNHKAGKKKNKRNSDEEMPELIDFTDNDDKDDCEFHEDIWPRMIASEDESQSENEENEFSEPDFKFDEPLDLRQNEDEFNSTENSDSDCQSAEDKDGFGEQVQNETFICSLADQQLQCDRIQKVFQENESKKEKPDNDDFKKRDAVKAQNLEDLLDWPQQSEQGINEFTTDSMAAMCYVQKFPYSCGDFTKRGRVIKVTDEDALEFYEQFADYNEQTQTINYRFATDMKWSFWAMNRRNRHFLLRQTNFYLSRHPFAHDMTYNELLEEIKRGESSPIQQGINMYSAKLDGSDPMWWQECENLKWAVTNLSCPLLFYTISYPDHYDPTLHKLLPYAKDFVFEESNYKERAKMLNTNLHISAWYFKERFSSLMKHVRKVFCATWFWQRIEMQGRLAPHGHGVFATEYNKQFIEWSFLALLKDLAEKRIIALRKQREVDKEQLIKPDQTHHQYAEERYQRFELKEHEQAQQIAKQHIEAMKAAYLVDQQKKLKSQYSYYVGVSCEKQTDTDMSENDEIMTEAPSFTTDPNLFHYSEDEKMFEILAVRDESESNEYPDMSDDSERNEYPHMIQVQANDNADITSGNRECKTAKLQGLMNPEVVLAIPHLSACVAWTSELSMIEYIKALAPLRILNKSATFGLGRLPKNFQKNKTKYTLTLVRGINRDSRFNAYPQISEAVDKAKGDFKIAIQNLTQIVEDGKKAEERIVDFVDYVISTWNPDKNWVKENPGDRPGKIDPHPSMTYPIQWLCERDYFNDIYKEANDIKIPFEQLKNDLQVIEQYTAFTEEYAKFEDAIDLDHAKLLTSVQLHRCSSPTYCQRLKKATKTYECRFGFPHCYCFETKLEFERHGVNEHGDIYYKIVIKTRRNDPIINKFCRFVFDHARCNFDMSMVLDPIVCMQYIVKYTAKAEVKTKNASEVMNAIVRSAGPHQSTAKTIRSMVLKTHGQRAYCNVEIAMHNLGLKMVETNLRTYKICLSDKRRINVLFKHQDPDRPAFKNELRDLYATRVTDFEKYNKHYF